MQNGFAHLQYWYTSFDWEYKKCYGFVDLSGYYGTLVYCKQVAAFKQYGFLWRNILFSGDFLVKTELYTLHTVTKIIFLCFRGLSQLIPSDRIYKIKNSSILEKVMAILVRPEKVAKSTQNSLKGCTFRNIAGVGQAEKNFCKWISSFQAFPLHPRKSNFVFKK